MTVTRANVEAILVKRTGPLLTKAGMAVTVAGSNADLNDPIGWALRQAGYSVSDIATVADADLADVADDDIDQMLDLAELRTLESILGNLDDVDLHVGPRAESFSQLAEQVQKKVDRLTKKLQAAYGYNAPSLETGLLTYEFAEHYTGSED